MTAVALLAGVAIGWAARILQTRHAQRRREMRWDDAGEML